jgi:hypothetical protein
MLQYPIQACPGEGRSPLLRPVACLAPQTAAQPEECSPARATCQPARQTRRHRTTRARRRPAGLAITAPLPALQNRPSDATAPAVARPTARPVTITMLLTLASPTPLHPSAALSRTRRRSPALPRNRRKSLHGSDLTSQSNGISERPSCPRRPSTCRLPHPTASTLTRSGRNLHRPVPLPRRGLHPVNRVRSTEPARPLRARKL